MSTRRTLLLVGLLATVYLFLYAAWVEDPTRALGYDFLSYWRAAIDTYTGVSPYRADVMGPVVAWTGPGPFRYPPPFAPLAIPLLLLDFRQAAIAWGLGQFLAWCLAIFLVWRSIGSPHGRRTLFIGGALIASFSTWSGTIEGNISLSLGLLAALGLWAERRGREAWAGAAYAIAALWKITPAVLLLGIVAARRWRALLGALVATTVLILLTLRFDGVQLGWSDYLGYPLRALVGSDGGNPWNFGLAAMLARGPLGATWLTPLVILVALSAAALALFAGRRLTGVERWSALLLLSVVGSPAVWPHTLALAMLAAAPLAQASRHGRWHLLGWACSLLAFFAGLAPLAWVALMPTCYELGLALRRSSRMRVQAEHQSPATV